jgi:SAM-dependent methyltransferase
MNYDISNQNRLLWYSDLINSLLKYNKGKKYLEIGVLFGDTFSKINAEYKVGVDIVFQNSLYLKNNEKYVIMPSDNYFNINKDLFDLIFIDGDHTYNQSKNDLFNSLKILNNGGIIVLDDVFPLDEIASLPTLKDQEEARIKNNDKTICWNGDVYKTLVYIHNYMPEINYLYINHKLAYNGSKAIVWLEKTNREHIDVDIDSLNYQKLLTIEHRFQQDPDKTPFKENLIGLLRGY